MHFAGVTNLVALALQAIRARLAPGRLAVFVRRVALRTFFAHRLASGGCVRRLLNTQSWWTSRWDETSHYYWYYCNQQCLGSNPEETTIVYWVRVRVVVPWLNKLLVKLQEASRKLFRLNNNSIIYISVYFILVQGVTMRVFQKITTAFDWLHVGFMDMKRSLELARKAWNWCYLRSFWNSLNILLFCTLHIQLGARERHERCLNRPHDNNYHNNINTKAI